MLATTNTIKRLGAVLAGTAALLAIPMAQAFDGPPDALDRYTANHAAVVEPAIQGSPDALDRFASSQALVVQPAIQGSPDAIDRFGATQALLTQPAIQSSPDALDRYLGRTAAPVVVTGDGGFAWSEFGIGAGAMLGALLLLLGLGLGALTVRHRGGELRTS